MAELIRRDSLLAGIEEIKKSPWFNCGKELDGFPHALYLERKQAVEMIVDMCIKEEPEVSPCIGCQKDNCQWRHCAPPEQKPINWGDMET